MAKAPQGSRSSIRYMEGNDFEIFVARHKFGGGSVGSYLNMDSNPFFCFSYNFFFFISFSVATTESFSFDCCLFFFFFFFEWNRDRRCLSSCALLFLPFSFFRFYVTSFLSLSLFTIRSRTRSSHQAENDLARASSTRGSRLFYLLLFQPHLPLILFGSRPPLSRER